ncbi:MAG: hypothetical protein EHM33_03820 [Chloroflexi bacterium]|nr:MAG: hypothetical protein EHM33_03820 [Chloroflexota bacterium]
MSRFNLVMVTLTVAMFLSTSSVVLADEAGPPDKPIHSGTMTKTNGIYSIFVEDVSSRIGTYTASTGANHPITLWAGSPQNVLYGGAGPEQVKDELDRRIKDFRAVNNRNHFKNIDVSKFKTGMDVKDVTRIIRLAIEGYEKELQEKLDGKSLAQIDQEYDKYLTEFDAFLKDLENCFYQ